MNSLSYAIGRIRAKEAFLLDGESVLRAASAKDFESAFAVLSENRHWADRIQKLESPFDYSLLLDKETAWLLSLMRDLCPGCPEIEAMASKYSGRPTGEEYICLLEKAATKSSSGIFKAFAAAKKAFHKVKTELLDKKISADIMDAKYAFSDFAKQIAAAVEEFKRTGSLARLDKEEDDFCMGVIKPAKYSAFGSAPLAGFFAAKETEIKNLRLVLSSKHLEQPLEKIKPMLRMSYV